MNEILHIITAADWAAAQQAGQLAPVSLADEGFIHCSTRLQAPGVVARFYADFTDLLLLVIDGDAVDELRWEPPAHPDGSLLEADEATERFPHVYEPIPLDAVRRVEQVG